MDRRIVESSEEGLEIAKNILYGNVDKKTALFLSGGSTPKNLYKKLAQEKMLQAGAVAMVDDRYTFHQQYSNEIMVKDSGLLSYLEAQNVAFYSILKFGLSASKIAAEYDETVSFLLNHFPKSVAILGIGADGHTAGIPILDQKIESQNYVEHFVGFPEEPKERISLTFKALSIIDLLIVLAFGEEKRQGIEIALINFYSKKEVFKKTILITDQEV